MTKNTYYKFLKQHHLDVSRSRFSETEGCIYTSIKKLEHKNGMLYINGVVAPNMRAIPHNGALYNYILMGGTGVEWYSESRPHAKRARKTSLRIPTSCQHVTDWIIDLIADDKIVPLDDFDVDKKKRQKLILGGAIKFASHSTPLEDLYWRPGISVAHGILVASENIASENIASEEEAVASEEEAVASEEDRKGGMTRKEVKEFLNVERHGDRANWWLLYQVALKHGNEALLEKAPRRSFALYRHDAILLTMAVAYPNATVPAKNPGTRVWDPF